MGTVIEQSTKMFDISREAALKEIGKLVRLKGCFIKRKKERGTLYLILETVVIL